MYGRILSFMKISRKKFIKKHYFYEYNMYIHISIVMLYGARIPKGKKSYQLSASTILLTVFNFLARVVKAKLRFSSYPFLYI